MLSMRINGIMQDRVDTKLGFIDAGLGEMPIGVGAAVSLLATGISGLCSISAFRGINREPKFGYKAGLVVGGGLFAVSGVVSLVNTVILISKAFVTQTPLPKE
jgi:hypothetical protein